MTVLLMTGLIHWIRNQSGESGKNYAAVEGNAHSYRRLLLLHSTVDFCSNISSLSNNETSLTQRSVRASSSPSPGVPFSLSLCKLTKYSIHKFSILRALVAKSALWVLQDYTSVTLVELFIITHIVFLGIPSTFPKPISLAYQFADECSQRTPLF